MNLFGKTLVKYYNLMQINSVFGLAFRELQMFVSKKKRELQMFIESTIIICCFDTHLERVPIIRQMQYK